MDSFLGTVFYSLLIFIAGTLIGAPLFGWVRKMFPWNK